jgi:hypothetical protein
MSELFPFLCLTMIPEPKMLLNLLNPYFNNFLNAASLCVK